MDNRTLCSPWGQSHSLGKLSIPFLLKGLIPVPTESNGTFFMDPASHILIATETADTQIHNSGPLPPFPHRSHFYVSLDHPQILFHLHEAMSFIFASLVSFLNYPD